MRRRELLTSALPAAALIQGWLQTPLPPPSAPGELLYNGIRLPAEWPPRLPDGIDTAEPAPYLVHPPKVIPVDVGRQLFVDDFLIEETTLQRVFHRAAYDARSPVLRPDRAWERNVGRDESPDSRRQPVAMVFRLTSPLAVLPLMPVLMSALITYALEPSIEPRSCALLVPVLPVFGFEEPGVRCVSATSSWIEIHVPLVVVRVVPLLSALPTVLKS